MKGKTVLVTGSNMHRIFVGSAGSVRWNRERMRSTAKRFMDLDIDIRDRGVTEELFCSYHFCFGSALRGAAFALQRRATFPCSASTFQSTEIYEPLLESGNHRNHAQPGRHSERDYNPEGTRHGAVPTR